MFGRVCVPRAELFGAPPPGARHADVSHALLMQDAVEEPLRQDHHLRGCVECVSAVFRVRFELCFSSAQAISSGSIVLYVLLALGQVPSGIRGKREGRRSPAAGRSTRATFGERASEQGVSSILNRLMVVVDFRSVDLSLIFKLTMQVLCITFMR